MPPKLLYDISSLDLERPAYSIDEIRKANPQRHEFEQLSAILHLDPDEKVIVGLRDVQEDEFWARGHIPGSPLFPGVLMVEAAAQLSCFYCRHVVGTDGFYGFGGIDHARFRGTVRPGDRLVLVGRPISVSRNRSKFATQGLVNGKIVFESTVLGVRLPTVVPSVLDN